MTARLHPLAELVRFVAGSILDARTNRRFHDLMGWEAAQDVVADAVKHNRDVANKAHAAEQHALLAAQAMDAAQQPDSDGGENITLAEAKRIRALDMKAAQLAHDASDLATV